MIIVDDRTGSRDLIDFPFMAERAILGTLEFGDAMMSGHGPDGSTITVGVEVKSISDLMASISTGRLGGHQIPGMLKTYDRSWLLVYGEWVSGKDGSMQVRKGGSWKTARIGRRTMPWAYVEGFLLTLQMKAGVGVKLVRDMEQAARFIAVMDRWLSKPWDEHNALNVWDRSREQASIPETDPTEDLIARVAAQLPAINWVRGWAAAKHFESVQDMINAEWREWNEIHGIGPVIAKNAVIAIRRKR